MAQHHHPGKDHRTGVHLVLAGVLRSGAVGGLEDCVSSHIVDVSPRCDPDAADLRSEGIRDVVAVEVHRGDHVVLVGPGEDLLQECVGDRVLDQQAITGVALALLPGHGLRAELLLRQLVTPGAKRTLRELHDVALVHKGHRLAMVHKCVRDGGAHQALRSGLGDRLDPDGTVGPNLPPQLIAEELQEPLRLGGSRGCLQAGVHVLGVLPEDHHVDLLRMLHRRWHTRVPAHRPDARVEVHDLADRNIDAADPSSDGSRQRPLDPDEVRGECVERCLGKPFTGRVECLLPSEDLGPLDAPFAGVRLLDGGIKYTLRRRPDVRPGAVTLDKGNDRPIGHLETLGSHGDGGSGRGWCHEARVVRSPQSSVLSQNRHLTLSRVWLMTDD